MTADDQLLPQGVRIRALQPHADDRGVFTEIFREEWATGMSAVQWNLVHSAARVLRGVHVHVAHHDYIVVVAGRLVLGLHDLRPESPTAGQSHMVALDDSELRGITIPPGVCHGFYFPVPSTHVYAVSAYWNVRDELGCRFDCQELRLSWPEKAPLLSRRDREAGSYEQMRAAFCAARQACHRPEAS